MTSAKTDQDKCGSEQVRLGSCQANPAPHATPRTIEMLESVGVDPGRQGRGEEGEVAGALGSGHSAEELAVLVRHRPGGGKALVLQVAERVQITTSSMLRALTFFSL